MKVIRLKNNDLVSAILFMKSLAMEGRPTRGKQKFVERLIEKNNEFFDQEKELVKPYCELDGDENPIIEGNNYLLKEDISDEEKEQMGKQRKELAEEIAEISFVEYSNKYEALFETLSEWPKEIAAEYSYIYDVLMDEYERKEEE